MFLSSHEKLAILFIAPIFDILFFSWMFIPVNLVDLKVSYELW